MNGMAGVLYFCSEKKGANRKRSPTSAVEDTSEQSQRGLIMMNRSNPADYEDHGPLIMKEDHDGIVVRAEHGTNTGTDGSATEHMEEPPSPTPSEQQRRIQEAQVFAKAEEARKQKRGSRSVMPQTSTHRQHTRRPLQPREFAPVLSSTGSNNTQNVSPEKNGASSFGTYRSSR